MSDYEDTFEDYGFYGDFNYEDDDEGYYPSEYGQTDSPDTEKEYSEEEEDYDREDDDEDYDYDKDYLDEGYDPSDYGRVGMQGEFYFEKKSRYRSVRDVILARMYGILGNTEYDDFDNEVKNKAVSIIEKIPEKKVILFSIEVLVPSALYMAQYKKVLSKNNVTDFFKRTSGLKIVDRLDFIRYVRIIQNLEKNEFIKY